MELNRLSWETFTRTGDIDAYLLYKTALMRKISVMQTDICYNGQEYKKR